MKGLFQQIREGKIIKCDECPKEELKLFLKYLLEIKNRKYDR